MLTEKELELVFEDIIDPEIGIDIWNMGLIYEYSIHEDKVEILLTFTSPTCPYGPQMVEELKKKIKDKGVEEVEVEITFDPPWEASEELKEMLGM